LTAGPLNRARAVHARWHRMPLRTRLTTAAAIAAAIAIVSVVGVAYIAVHHVLRAQVDQQLRRSAKIEVHTVVGPDGQPRVTLTTGAGEIGGYSQLIAADGTASSADPLPVNASDIAIASSGLGTVIRDASYRDKHVRLLTEPAPNLRGYAVQVALPLTGVDEVLGKLAIALLLLTVGGIALTVVLAWAAVRRITRPIRTLTDTAERIATTRDLTLRISREGDDELGRLALSFNTMLDALDRSLGAQRQLVLDASHELRTPLASLRTNAEVLGDLDRLSPEQRQAVLSGIVTQLDELTELVGDVVELARGESQPAEHEDVAFDDLVLAEVERAQRYWPSVRFEVDTEPVAVRGVPRRLDRAVTNMLDNAAKFSPPGGVVEVRLTRDGTLVVADRGAGVPSAALPYVFDRFYRADEARALPGSGLGLAIVQQVALGHGGTIELDNRPGGGAVATLRLPVLDRTAAPV
jgi:two-component system sensor histidine kinase MprB